MIRFRRMELKDLDGLYRDQSLRPLLLVEPSGEKFGVVLESEGKLLGGITGYTSKAWGRIQCACLCPEAQDPMLLDGLIRSAIHILELSGCIYLITEESGPLYEGAGFQPMKSLPSSMPESFANTLPAGRPLNWLNLPEFFRQDPHGGEAESQSDEETEIT